MEKDLIEWVRRLSERRDELGGFSICPFAKKAMEDKKIFMEKVKFNPVPHIREYMEYLNGFGNDSYEVAIFYFDDVKFVTNEDLLIIIKELQRTDKNRIYLKDHPDDPGYINGVITGNQKFPMILVQPAAKLKEAREKLKRTDYYDNWSDEYKHEIWSYGNES